MIDAPAGVAPFEVAAREGPVNFLLDWLEIQSVFASIISVGHRIVHGMKHAGSERIPAKLLAELRRIIPVSSEDRCVGFLDPASRLEYNRGGKQVAGSWK